jgi:hypothetical protein
VVAHPSSIAVIVRLVRPLYGNSEVCGLFLRQLGKLCSQAFQVKPGDLLVEYLGEGIDAGF